MRKLFGIIPLVLAGCAHSSIIAKTGPEGADAYVELFGACPAVVTHFRDGKIDVQLWSGTMWVSVNWPSIDPPSGCEELKR